MTGRKVPPVVVPLQWEVTPSLTGAWVVTNENQELKTDRHGYFICTDRESADTAAANLNKLEKFRSLADTTASRLRNRALLVIKLAPRERDFLKGYDEATE